MMMRHVTMALFMAAGLALAGASATNAAPLGASSGTSGVGEAITKVEWGRCSYLRYRCEHKSELGEWGEGNCRRYHSECGRRPSYCERLRDACRYKYERGEEGQGNCRRYHAECGGGSY